MAPADNGFGLPKTRACAAARATSAGAARSALKTARLEISAI
jgi:hypothetical protein